MALGRINGPMLTPNLERQGINIALDGSLTYWDVNNRYVGINTTTPNYPLDISGNAHIGNLYILGNTITTDSGMKLNLGNISNVSISGGSVNNILFTDGNGNLTFGNVDIMVAGNLVTIGTPTQGNLTNYVTLTPTTSITDSIALLNWQLGNTISNVTTLTREVYANSNVATYMSVFGGNILGNVITANTFIGNIRGNFSGNVNGNITTTSQPYITSLGTLTNLTVSGNTVSGNLVTNGTIYGNILADTIGPFQTNVVAFTNSTAVKLPVGDTGTRPTGTTGYIRFNTDTSVIEFYNGTMWVPVMNQIRDQQITPDGANTDYTLDQSVGSATALLVSINGTVQRPGVAYSVSDTTISFAEIPGVNDVIDIRYIASAVATNDLTIIDTPNVAVGTSNVIVDSFNAGLYRSVKYTVSSLNNVDGTYAEVGLIQTNGVVMMTAYAIMNTGSNTLIFDSNISGSTINFLVRGTTLSNQVRVQKTYFSV